MSVPPRCLRIPQEDLDAVSRIWQPLLERQDKAQTSLVVMKRPYTGDDWRADGPVLSLSYSSSTEDHFRLMWDARLSLPRELDIAVIATLEMVCSNSRLAKKHLLQGLPKEVGGRLQCS